MGGIAVVGLGQLEKSKHASVQQENSDHGGGDAAFDGNGLLCPITPSNHDATVIFTRESLSPSFASHSEVATLSSLH
jgi:hypothetical protein